MRFLCGLKIYTKIKCFIFGILADATHLILPISRDETLNGLIDYESEDRNPNSGSTLIHKLKTWSLSFVQSSYPVSI